MVISRRQFLEFTTAGFTEVMTPSQRDQIGDTSVIKKMPVYFNFKEAMRSSKDDSFMISQTGIMFPFKWKLTGHEKTVILVPGRTAREKPVPSFQRSSYFKDLPFNCISCFDPTLFYSPTLTLGWFQGRRNTFFAPMLAKLVQQLIAAISTSSENVLIYGTSGGGIPGFHIAAGLPGSSLYVSNIQTDVRQYDPRAFEAMAKVCYPDDTLADVKQKYPQRLSIHHIDAPFNLTYAQNREDRFHFERHFQPYMKDAAAHAKIDKTFIAYDDAASGHGPLPRETELEIMSRMLYRKSVLDLLPNGVLLRDAAAAQA